MKSVETLSTDERLIKNYIVNKHTLIEDFQTR